MRKLLNFLLFLSLWTGVQAQAPTVQASNLVFSEVYCSRVTVSWTNGNGAGRIVVARKGNPVTWTPDTSYAIARDTFGLAASLQGTDEYVVYNGTGNSVIVFGLEMDSTYYFTVYEHNGSGNTYSYLTSNSPVDSVHTEWLRSDFTMDVTHQCEYLDTTRYTQQVTSSQSNTVSFLWTYRGTTSLANGTLGTDSVVVHSFSAGDVYEITLTASSIGCKHSFTRPDTIAPMPQASLILDPDSLPRNKAIQCYYNADGTRNRFSFTRGVGFDDIGLTSTTILSWDFGDGTTSNQSTAKVKTYDNPGIYRVVFTASRFMGNQPIYCDDSAALIVEVKPRPLDSTLVYLRDTSMCLNSNLFFFSNRTGIQSARSVWYFGDGDSTVADSATHTYASAGYYGVEFNIIDTAGCFDKFIDTIEVVPQPNNFFTGLAANYCQGGQQVTLSPNLSGGDFYVNGNYQTDSFFTPNQLGLNTVQYIYQINNCFDTSEVSTQVMPIPRFSLGSDTSICVNSNYDLIIAADSSSFLWQDASSDSQFNVNGAGLYWAEKNNGWCSYRDSIQITVISPPSISLGSDSTLCGGNYRTIVLTSDEATYIWNDGSNADVREITESGQYWVSVSNKCGVDQDTVDLVVLPYACELYIPNAFSPNGDEYNPVFRALGQVNVTKMIIFNRWGEMLYESTDSNPSWDGTYQGERVPEGVYFFQITYMKPNQNQEVPTQQSGQVYVLY